MRIFPEDSLSAAIFFQIDQEGRCRTGKIMKYDAETGHRIKDPNVPGALLGFIP